MFDVFKKTMFFVLLLLPCVCRGDDLDDFINKRVQWTQYCLESIEPKLTGLSEVEGKSDAQLKKALLDVVEHLKKMDRKKLFDYPEVSDAVMHNADDVLKDKLTIMGIKGDFEYTEQGGVNWLSYGNTGNDQWPTLMNRHLYMLDLLAAYRKTGEAKYTKELDEHLADWLMTQKSPMTKLRPKKVEWAVVGAENLEVKPETVIVTDKNPHWYTLNAAIRLDTWLKVFWGSLDVEHICDNTRAMMLVSMFEHCVYVRWHHRDTGNWKVGEMKALAKAALAFPEFLTSQDWLEYSIDQLEEELHSQVYPDGVQKELCASYHRGVLNAYAEIEDFFGRNDRKLPPDFAKTMQKMYEYLAFSSRNDGYAPLNNDSDKDYVAPLIRKAAAKYRTDELRYVASFGENGKWRRSGYSVVFDYAGHAIFRNGFAKDSHWSYFEIGPWGIGHQHNDKLHISVAAGGRDLLVDGGRYTYNGYHDLSDKWRNYFTSSFSHNLILIEGAGQSGYAKEAESPLDPSNYYICEDFSFARGTFDAGYAGLKDRYAGRVQGKVSHTRNVVYVNDIGWIVVDHIDADRPHTIEALWHFHPECSVRIDDGNIFTVDEGKTNLLIKPLGDIDFDIRIVNGLEEPPVQGWYSVKFGVKETNDTAVCKAQLQGSATFCWLIMPFEGETDNIIANEKMRLIKDVVDIKFRSLSSEVRAVVPIKEGHARAFVKIE
jgi:hypothetical protein